MTGVVKYTFNRFLSGNLVGEHFFPGKYYESPKDDEALELFIR